LDRPGTGARVVIVLLVVAAAAAVCGRAAAQPAVTRVRLLAPFGPEGLAPSLTVSARVAGRCFAASLASQGRADAWRCMSGNRILDPCYEGHNAAGLLLACATSPWSTAIVVLTPSEPIRAPANRADVPGSLPWALELGEGARCQFLTGATAPVAGMRINYGCAKGASVVGPVDRSTPRWRVFYATAHSAVVEQRDVATAWY
jgi:hypothetical protein